MLIGTVKEKYVGEKRIALTPDIAGRLVADGIEVCIEKNAGCGAGFDNESYARQGVKIENSAYKVYTSCNMIFKIWAPYGKEWHNLKHTPIILADFSRLRRLPDMPIRAFALNKIPRISRAQNMDILSSQSNLSGYKAAIAALDSINRIAPMMITAAGTLPPIKVLIWGLGVAGLQAAATFRRNGAKVFAADIRPETSEQAASVGAIFIPSEKVVERIAEFDIIITAAGNYRQAPLLITRETFASIPTHNLVMDISGNVEKKIVADNLIREYNGASALAHSASLLFAENLYRFFRLIYDFPSQNINVDFNDEIIKQTYIGEKRNV